MRSAEFVRSSEVEKWEPAAEISLTVSGGATPSDTSSLMNVRGARALTLQLDHNRVGSNSTSLTATVYTSKDGAKVDNEAYATVNLAAAKVKTIPIAVGVNYVQVVVANGDAVNATKVLPAVIVTY